MAWALAKLEMEDQKGLMVMAEICREARRRLALCYYWLYCYLCPEESLFLRGRPGPLSEI